MTIPGLSYLTKLVLLPFQFVLMPVIIGFYLPNRVKKPRQIKVQLDDQFKNKERFKSLLEKS